MTPFWRMLFPAMVMFPCGTSISPKFKAVPAPLPPGKSSVLIELSSTFTFPMNTSSPRRLGSSEAWGLNPTCKPAARIVCPLGVIILPSFITCGPTRATSPPVLFSSLGEVMVAPFSTTTFPNFPEGETSGIKASVGPFLPPGTARAEKRK